jgi:hypothetical protein
MVDAAIPPLLWAMRRPAVVLLPAALFARLSHEQQTALLTHELAHYVRRDHWVRWFEVFVIGIYWWHPIAWLARRELQRAEEQCCDAAVLRTLPASGCAYARAILQTIDFLATDRCRPPMLATGLGPVHLLERRLEMILDARPTRHLPVAAQLFLVVAGLIVVPISAKGQLAAEPAAPAAPAAELRPAAAPAAAPVAPVASPATVSVDVPGEAAPVLVTTAEPSVQFVGPGDVEQRLQRLEKMMQEVLVELKGERAPRPRIRSSASTVTTGAFLSPARQSHTSSLANLKKQRIDIEEQLESLQDRLTEIDDQIAKLQSDRAGKRTPREPLQVK